MTNKPKNPFSFQSFLKSLFIGLCIAVGIHLLLSVPFKPFTGVDYYTYQGAGNPYNINQFIEVEDAEGENSNFYLTYVSSINAHNLSQLLYVKFYNFLQEDFDLDKVPEEKNYKPDTMSEEELRDYYIFSTQRSLENAIYTAYNKANKPLPSVNEGLVVTFVNNKGDFKRDNVSLKQGDYIISVNDNKVHNRDDLVSALKNVKNNETVNIKVSRKGKEVEVEHSVVVVNDAKYLGVMAEEGIDIEIPSELKFDQNNIQGASAGFMFTMYLIDQLTPNNDLSKGYKIAGTGTINHKGEIGQIDGVNYKLEGAIKNNFDIFFVPKDINQKDSNEKVAKETLSKVKDDIKVVPVANIDEALDYLDKLPTKK